MSGDEYRPQLDGLRALAVFGVIASHTVPGLGAFGSYGVRTFFVLSGFLITGILLRLRGTSGALYAFYARRVLRIFPLFYFVLALSWLLGEPHVRATIGWHLSYLSNIYIARLGDWPEPPIAHLWSLAVEEQFYLVWPILVLAVPVRALPWLIGSAIVCGPVARLLAVELTGSGVTAHVLMPGALGNLAFGAWLAWRSPSRREVNACGAVGLAGVLAMLVLEWLNFAWRVRIVIGPTFEGLMGLWLVSRAASGFVGLGQILQWKPLVYVGTISYGVYMYHQFVQVAASSLIHPGFAGFITVDVLSIAIAACSWHLLERPVSSLKRYFPYRAAPQAARTESPPTVAAGGAL